MKYMQHTLTSTFTKLDQMKTYENLIKLWKLAQR